MERALYSHQYGAGLNPGADFSCVMSLLLVFVFPPSDLSGYSGSPPPIKREMSEFQFDR